MDGHSCKYLIIACIDFRIQEIVQNWIQENLKGETHDFAAFAGSAKELNLVEKQVAIAQKAHRIKEVILISHEDCAAYDKSDQTKSQQIADLKKAKEDILKKFSGLGVKTYLLSISGLFENIA